VTSLNTYEFNGKVVGEHVVSDVLAKSDAHPQMIKDYLVALRANSRQWSANTKGRTEVNHTGKKPHKQKGTGGARQGCLAAPQYKGGGVVFGPKPKFDQHVKINRQEKRAAIRHLLTEKIDAGKLVIVKDFSELKQPKTKDVMNMLKALSLSSRSVLFVGESELIEGQSVASGRHDVIKMSVRNIPGSAFVIAAQLNGYDLVCAHSVVITEEAIKELERQLGA
jgi:large subunit ribosomal protein L4